MAGCGEPEVMWTRGGVSNGKWGGEHVEHVGVGGHDVVVSWAGRPAVGAGDMAPSPAGGCMWAALMDERRSMNKESSAVRRWLWHVVRSGGV